MIERAPAFVGFANQPNSDLPRQPLLRACLDDGSTPVSAKVALLQTVMKSLVQLSKNITRRGFDFQEDFDTLHEVYGNFDVFSEEGFCRTFVGLMMMGLSHNETDGESGPNNENTKMAIELIEKETQRLYQLLRSAESNDVVLNSLSSLLPLQADLDRVIRYEAHISREFDRKLGQLERLQRARRGYPSPPTIKLELD